jgi:hypothetical protein
MIKRKITKLRKRKNPYISTYGYHATNSDYLKSILANGLKTKLLNKKDNYERWVYNQILYNGRSPIYFLTVPNFSKVTEELKYTFSESKFDIILKVNVEKFNQLPDLYLLLDYGENFELEIPEKFENAYIRELSTSPLKNHFWETGKRKVKDFLNEDLATDTIIFTESFCIAENIPAKYIEGIIYI